MLLTNYFLEPRGLWTALALLPLILLYLIRPKPRLERIPSLLFILKDLGKDNTRSFFRNFLRDPLLILQLLFLLLLIAAAAKPYITIPRTALASHTILIIDTSASTQADDRFEHIIAIARDHLGKENTIILAQARPETIGERLSVRRAEKLLETLEPTDTTTDLTGALQLASTLAAPETIVEVISDFNPTTGDPDYDTAADALEALGATVNYHPVTSDGSNLGITDLRVGPTRSSVWIKNYDRRPRTTTLRIAGNDQELLLAKGETKRVDFETPTGTAELHLLTDDVLAVDNTAYLSTPEKTTIRLLIITNDKEGVEQSKLLVALDVLGRNFPTSYDLTYAEPPKLPTLDFDAYLIWNANLDFLLPGHIRNLKERVQDGAALIFLDQHNLFSIDWQGLLPVEAVNNSAGTRATIIPEPHSLTTDIEFGQVPSYRRVKAAPDTTILAKTAHDPIIVLGTNGKGSTLYYGLPDDSSFTTNPSYPIFWRRTFDLLTHRPNLATLNRRTGDLLVFPRRTTVRLPSGATQETALLSLDHAGFYQLPDRIIAANLLSDREGALEPHNLTRRAGNEAGETTDRVPYELTDTLLLAALTLLFLEVLYLKYRGDL